MLRRNEGTCPSSPSDDEVGELEDAIRAERAKRAEQSNRSGQRERVIEAGVPRDQNSSADDPGHVRFDSDDLGPGKSGGRQPVTLEAPVIASSRGKGPSSSTAATASAQKVPSEAHST